ncbi:hypothetical protein [Mariniflexile sp.]|uniref:hypothetical protein n=1 Tax=Mariniflexile sp. TaxID=1979402 RepID=UPI00404790FE
MNFLSKEEYVSYVNSLLEDGHWTKDTISNRWDYHYRAIELIRATKVSNSKKILEMGTMGISCVKDSDTIDYDERWDFNGKNPTYLHDARQIPWPIENKKYDVFVALRVFQHLVPTQSEAIKEAFRIAKKVLMVIPEDYDNPILPNAKGITYEDSVGILDGIHPNVYIPMAFGSLFFWDTENPSCLNIKSVMKDIKLFTIETTKNTIPVSKKNNIKVTAKKLIKKVYKKLKR